MLKLERRIASQLLAIGLSGAVRNSDELVSLSEKALYASKITSYAQGFGLLRRASQEYGFGFNYADIARIWRAGCIIRASLLDDIACAFETDPKLSNLLLNEVFRNIILESQSAWREVVKTAIDLGIPMMATSASLAYFDAQRDFFGAHTHRRVEREGSFHTNWE